MKLKGSILLLLALGQACAVAPSRSHDLCRGWKPVAGHRAELSVNLQGSKRLVYSSGGRLFKEDAGSENRSFRSVHEVVSYGSDGTRVGRLAVSLAEGSRNGQTFRFGFHGKSVHVSCGADGGLTFWTEEGRPFEGEALIAVFQACPMPHPQEKGIAVNSACQPPGPVAVGASWRCSPRQIAVGLLDKDMVPAVDLQQSAVVLTLKSVEVRAGVEWARVEGAGELVITNHGGIRFDPPLSARVTVEIEACIDGTLPDATLSMACLLKPRSRALWVDRELDIEGEFVKRLTLSRRTVK